MAPPTRSWLTAPTIQRARVLDVNTTHYTLTVATEFTKKPLSWIAWASPYMHMDNGEGIYCMPEVGSVCWLVEPSDGGMPFVIAWASIEDTSASHRNRRQSLNPGDIYLGTRDENFMVLRRGGVVQVGATPLAQRLFLPIDNIIKDLCENYSLQTLGGSLEWTVGRKEENGEGKYPTVLTLQARQHADDAKPLAFLRIGSHEGDEDAILSLVLNADGSEAQQPALELKITKSGSVSYKLPKVGNATPQVQWDIEGVVTLHADTSMNLTSRDISAVADQNLALEGKSLVTIKGGSVEITGKPKVTVKSKLDVGTAKAPALLHTPDMMAWIQGVSQFTKVPAPTQHIAQDLKSS